MCVCHLVVSSYFLYNIFNQDVIVVKIEREYNSVWSYNLIKVVLPHIILYEISSIMSQIYMLIV